MGIVFEVVIMSRWDQWLAGVLWILFLVTWKPGNMVNATSDASKANFNRGRFIHLGFSF